MLDVQFTYVLCSAGLSQVMCDLTLRLYKNIKLYNLRTISERVEAFKADLTFFKLKLSIFWLE